jgi:mannose-6-phosphate isomerase-like protein (cupin superfamily)
MEGEVEMRLRAITLALLGITLVSSEAAAITTYSTSVLQKIIAFATVPDRNDTPLYFNVRAGILKTNKVQEISFGDGIYYQLSGSAEIKIKGKITDLSTGDGVFIPVGTQFVLRPHDVDRAPTYLKFLLLPAGQFRPFDEPGLEREVYRSPSPVSRVMPVRNLLTLRRVQVPPHSPCDPLHQRSGAALHYILSGAGAEFTENRATARAPGSISYQPNTLAYQWSNPGSTPLVYLVFNVSPEDEPPVIAADVRAMDPFSRDVHLTLAMYCIALSMILIAAVAVWIATDPYDEVKTRRRRGKE